MKKIKQSNVCYLLGMIWKICKKKLIWNGFISFLTSVESFIFNVVFIRIIVDILDSNGNIRNIVCICVTILILRIVIGGLKSIYNKRYSKLFDIEISEQIKKKLFKKISSLNLEYCESKECQSRYYKMIEMIENVVHAVIDNSFQLVGHLLSMVFVLAYVISIDPVLLVLIIIPIITSKAMKVSGIKRYEYEMEVLEAKRRQDYINRVIYLKEYAMELRMTNIFDLLKDRYIEAGKKIRIIIKRYGFSLAVLRIISDFFMTTASIFFTYLYMGWKYFCLENIEISDFAVLINAINNMNGKSSMILRNIYVLQENGLYIQQLREFLEYETIEVEKSTDNKIVFGFNQIDIKDICYKYPTGLSNAVNNLKLSIVSSEKIAVVGPNGSGKSTFIKVLLGLYDSTNGNISVDGRDIKEIGAINLKKLFCPIFQDFRVYAISIKENILRGEKLSDEVIWHGLEAVGLKEEIMMLEHGLDTIITKESCEDGVVFSEGQLQRLMVARAFITSSPIIILDEPTAALDAEVEKDIYENIYRLLPNKTVIFVTHRLTATMKADKILMLEKGSGIEFGSHKELMEMQGEYYKMFNTQAKVYLSNGGRL